MCRDYDLPVFIEEKPVEREQSQSRKQAHRAHIRKAKEKGDTEGKERGIAPTWRHGKACVVWRVLTGRDSPPGAARVGKKEHRRAVKKNRQSRRLHVANHTRAAGSHPGIAGKDTSRRDRGLALLKTFPTFSFPPRVEKRCQLFF